MHHFTVDHLRVCFAALDGTKAPGVDGVTKAIYAHNLEDNLQALHRKLHQRSYRPQPVRRVEIPREDGVAFTCCPKPSTRERDARRVDAIKHMHAAGLAITLATGDPAMFETDIGEAYRRFFLGAHLGMADARAIALNAVDAAWLDEQSRAQLRQSFEDEIDALTSSFGAS